MQAEFIAAGIGAESQGDGDSQDLWGDEPTVHTPIFLQDTRFHFDRFDRRTRLEAAERR